MAQELISTGDGRAGATGRIDPESVRRPSLDVFPTDAAVRIDGLLTEAVWLQADSAYNFTQTLPREGFPASERTVVRVLYDATTLYIGAMMYDSDIGARTIPGLEQDYQTQNSDMLAITIDTYLDRANALLFGINPAGALFDAQSFNDRFGLGDISIRNYRTGSSPRNFRLFHTRRIGLLADRRPLPIGAGARLTGRAGGFEIGLLNMQTQRDGDLPGENFTVARLRRNLSGSSDAGFMFVNRQGTSTGAEGTYNRSFGADANFQLLRSMVVSTYYGRTDEPDVSGDQNASYLQIAWRDRIFDASTFVKHVGESFNPGVGFIRRTAMRQVFATVGIHPQPNVSFLQEINPYIDVSFISDLDWHLETRQLTSSRTQRHSSWWQRPHCRSLQCASSCRIFRGSVRQCFCAIQSVGSGSR